MFSVHAAARGFAREERGQASLMMLAVVAAVLAGAVVLFAFGNALGAKARYQRAADLAAISAAQVMRDLYPRLFEPPYIEPDVPNPRHLEESEYRAAAVAAAIRGGRRNGAAVAPADVTFPASGFAPTRVTVGVEARRGSRQAVKDVERGLGYRSGRAPPPSSRLRRARSSRDRDRRRLYGPLAYRQGEPMRPDVALAFDRMAAAARQEAGLLLGISSGFRSDAEQARLFAAHPDPKWVAPPGESLHRYATELDLAPPAAYAWLAANAARFGFVQRYSWEPWHYGFTRSPGQLVGRFRRQRRRRPRHAGGSVVRARSLRAADHPSGAALGRVGPADGRAALRRVELQPVRSLAGGRGGDRPVHARHRQAIGLADPFDPGAAIDAQGHLMRDLLGRFGLVPLALAAYNAGPGAVAGCGCIPPFPETRAYVARILGLLSGAGDVAADGFEVRLVS